MDRFGWNFGGRIPSCPQHVPMMLLPWQWPMPSNGALYIQQLWASGGRTGELILLKVGTQQQIRTTMTVTWSNIKIFKIQNWRTAAMLENIWIAITRLPMDQLGCNLGGRIPSCSRHVRHLAVAMAMAVQQLWASGGQTREPILLKFGTQQQLGPQWQSRDQILKFVKFKMADGRHVGKYSKCHISPTNSPTGTQLEWSHPIMFSTCPRCCCCHGNGRCRCVATVHWTFCSYGRLQAERVNQFWWNLVHNSKLGAQWQSRDQILKFLEFKMADGRHVGKYWKYHNSPSNGLIGTNPGWSHPITFPTCPP